MTTGVCFFYLKNKQTIDHFLVCQIYNNFIKENHFEDVRGKCVALWVESLMVSAATKNEPSLRGDMEATALSSCFHFP